MVVKTDSLVETVMRLCMQVLRLSGADIDQLMSANLNRQASSACLGPSTQWWCQTLP